MKEPEINVGIVNALEIAFTLNAKFLAKGETVSGKQRVSFDEGGISWNGNVYRELTFTPLEDDASFSLEDVTIGINFHWERQETQTFLGTLRLVAIKSVTDENDLMIINKSGITIRLKVADVRIMGRGSWNSKSDARKRGYPATAASTIFSRRWSSSKVSFCLNGF